MVAIVLFAAAALGGIILAVLRLLGKPLPLPLALVHGAAAAAGLVALAVAVLGSGLHAKVPLLLFVVAALGGFVLFSFHLRRKDIPVPVMLVHAIVAVVAFGLLLVGILGVG
jgi:hypothetical protein